MSQRLANRRIRLLVTAFAIVFAVALGRAAWLQAVRAPDLDELATSQQREQVTLPAHRGTIYDRHGVELAIGEEATTVYANPKEITSPREVAPVIARDLGLDPDTVLAAISDRSKGFVYVKRQADPEQARALEERDIPGLGFYREERRVYPQRKVAAAVIGFAGVDNDGLAGLELSYDDALAGENGRETIVRDPFGRLLDVVDEEPVENGEDVYSTIDHRLQAQVEQVLRETRAEWGAKGATAIVLDPKTGEVLAIAQAPGYDANAFASVPADRVRLRAVTDVYEPGSTFKAVTVAGALEEELVGPDTPFYLDDQIQVADRVIHELVPREPEQMTVRQILEHSSNVGVVTLALELGKRHLATWINRFGFGRRVGIDYPGESKGIVLPRRQWTGSTIGTVPLGQGIAVTAIQMAAAYGAIANGGVTVAPHLVTRVGGDEVPAAEERRMMTAPTASQLLGMMQDVVAEGTGTLAQIPGYTVAGKTGTAAKPEPTGGYSDTRYVASFVGIVPASAPRLVVLVAVDEPHGDIFGGTIAAPAFAEIASFALQYLDVPPMPRPLTRPADPAAGPPGGATPCLHPASAYRRRVRVCVSERDKRPANQPFSGAARGLGGVGPLVESATIELETLSQAIGATRQGPGRSLAVADLAFDSREVRPGTLFFCVPGATDDGHTHAAEAIARGAGALVVERELDVFVPQLVVTDVRRSMGPAADLFFGRPTRELTVAGVTGTNGKTTTSFLLFALLAAAGRRPGLLGTIESRVGGERRGVKHTTPEAIFLQRTFREMLDAGDRSCAMEASSHASALGRLEGTRFAALVFTNLSQDHLDLHGSMDAYYEAKRRLFVEPGPDGTLPPAAVNVGDSHGERLAAELRTLGGRLLTFGLEHGDIVATGLELGPGGASFHADGLELRTRLRGRFNVENVLGAVAAGRLLGLPDDAIARGVAHVTGVPGRLEPVEEGQPFAVLVDYAHTPTALEHVLVAAREICAGRLICVFGCGGDRDRGKRGQMGIVARTHADRAILTSDNPRSEDPLAIIAEVVAGSGGEGPGLEIEPDRRRAIRHAVSLADEDDVVVIAGKGHELGQTFADRTVPFSDVDEARDALRRLAAGLHT